MDIIFYGSHYWDRGPWFRKQHFANNLVERGHRVFYIENSVSMIRRKKSDKNRMFRTLFQKISDNLYVITPSTFFPFPNSFWSRYLYNHKLLNDIKRIIKKYHIEHYLFWFNVTYFSTAVKYLNPYKVVFDLSDDLPFFFKLSNNQKAYKAQMRFLEISYKCADIPVTTALKIKEKYQSLTPNEIIVIPNGHNFTKFRSDNIPAPKEMEGIKQPIIGFLGTLFKFIDDSLLEFLISSRPHYSFVFVGKTEPNFPLEKIKKYRNVYLLGEKSRDSIGNYIHMFDVCINPFKVHEVNDSVSPLKVFEYLAFHKQVVSSNMYSLQHEPISKYIRFGNTYEEILGHIDKIINNQDFRNSIPEEELLAYNWDHLFLRLADKVQRIYGLSL